VKKDFADLLLISETNDHTSRSPGQVVFGSKPAAEEGTNPEQRRKIGRNDQARKLFRIGGPCDDVEGKLQKGADPCEREIRGAPVEKVLRLHRRIGLAVRPDLPPGD